MIIGTAVKGKWLTAGAAVGNLGGGFGGFSLADQLALVPVSLSVSATHGFVLHGTDAGTLNCDKQNQ